MSDYLGVILRIISSLFVTALSAVFFSLPALSFSVDRFPSGPDENLTPGSVCSTPSKYRYPEHVAYCERNVDREQKQDVISDYDHKLGYSVSRMNRGDFKIDHYIPLCMGGSNRSDNLWPQHKSVYIVTDPLEQLLCEKMAMGNLRQADAIEMIKEAKNDLDRAPEIFREAQRL